MAKSPDSREEALKRFDERLDALKEQQTRKPMRFDGESSVGAGYRVIAELIGGVLGGLGLGWLVDRLAGTGPWGMIVGVMLGAAAAVFAIARSAGKASGTAEATAAKAGPVSVADEDDDEDRPLGGPRA